LLALGHALNFRSSFIAHPLASNARSRGVAQLS